LAIDHSSQLLERVVVEGRDLVLAHAFGRKPGRICTLQSRSTSVKTLSVPVPVTAGRQEGVATRTTPCLR